jgi:predicted ATPase
MPAVPARRPLALPPLHFPEELPIAQHRARIAELVRAHPVTIVCGETGSGKTTQIPKICLASGRGERGLIGCTQPRRIAARSLAHRLAQELPGAPPKKREKRSVSMVAEVTITLRSSRASTNRRRYPRRKSTLRLRSWASSTTMVS